MKIILEKYDIKAHEDLEDIFHYFGYKNQKEKLLEEIKEWEESESFTAHELEELCDIWIVLSGILCKNEEAEEIIKHKIERTLKRIEKEYYSDELNKLKSRR